MKAKLELKQKQLQTELKEYPSDWRIVKISDVSNKIKAGGTPSRKEPRYWGGDISFALIEDMTSCGLYLTKTKEKISNEGLENSSAWIVPPNSLLISMYATIGETAINKIPVTTNQAILAIIPKNDFHVIFGAYLLKYHAGRLIMQNIQSTQKNVNKGIVENFLIPLPPLPEQKNIAYVLSTVQEAKERTEQVINALKALKKAMMKHLFTYGPVSLEEAKDVKLKETEIGEILEEWDVVKLSELLETDPQNGIYKPQNLYGCGTHILRIDDFDNWGEVVTSAINRVRLSEKEIEKYFLHENDIVVNRVNSLSHLGKVALIGTLTEPAVFESNMMRFKLDETKAKPQYIFRFLASSFGREQMKAKAKRAVAQSSINQEDVKLTLIPLPNIGEQERIGEALSILEKRIILEKNKTLALKTLFRSMLCTLMTAKIRVKDLVISNG